MKDIERIAAHLNDLGANVVGSNAGTRQIFGMGQWCYNDEARIVINGSLNEAGETALRDLGPTIVHATASTHAHNGITRVPSHLGAEVIRIESWPDDVTVIRFGHTLKLDIMADSLGN